jgi:hypothetical protein
VICIYIQINVRRYVTKKRNNKKKVPGVASGVVVCSLTPAQKDAPRHKKMGCVCESCTQNFFRSAQRTRQYIQLPCAHTHTHIAVVGSQICVVVCPFPHILARPQQIKSVASIQKKEERDIQQRKSVIRQLLCVCVCVRMEAVYIGVCAEHYEKSFVYRIHTHTPSFCAGVHLFVPV